MESSPFEQLRHFFLSHPAAQKATKPLSNRACVNVEFISSSLLEIKQCHFIKEKDSVSLQPQFHEKPDFTLRMTPQAVNIITQLNTDNVGEFGIVFFGRVISQNSEDKVEIKINSGFLNLITKNYIGVLAVGGPSVMAWLARKGVSGIGTIKAVIKKLAGS